MIIKWRPILPPCRGGKRYRSKEPIIITKTTYCVIIIPICYYLISREEAPPGYIKSIVTKVVNNITINCNNLILKYVEEDIVLSVNVRFLSMQTVDNKWEPAFTGIYSILCF